MSYINSQNIDSPNQGFIFQGYPQSSGMLQSPYQNIFQYQSNLYGTLQPSEVNNPQSYEKEENKDKKSFSDKKD